MTPSPKISVAVATLNRACYLKRMLDSLLQTDYPNLEIIVMDGGSNDGTVGLLKSYGNKITRWVSEPDCGEYDALNKGLREATGQIMKPMTDDDVLRPQAFRVAADYFAEHPEVDIVFGRTWTWEERNGKPTLVNQGSPPDAARLTLRNFLRGTHGVTSLGAFLQRRAFDRIGLFSTQYVPGDFEFWARAAAVGLRMGVVPDVVVDYHFTGRNGIITKRWRTASDVLAVNVRYGRASDVMHCLWRKYLVAGIELGCTRLGIHIHPFRTWRRVRSGLLRLKVSLWST